jgi:hypothetical protein
VKRSIALLVVTLLVQSTGVSRADEPDIASKTMLKWCTDDPQTLGDVSCMLYVVGFVQALEIASSESKTLDICLPRNFTPAEARAVFIRTLRNIPQFQEERPDAALWASLGLAYPCAKKSN